MRASSTAPLRLVLPLSIVAALIGAGCQVGVHTPPGRDDGGPDTSLPPGVDGGVPLPDGMAPDRGLPPADTDGDGLSDDSEYERGTNPREVDSDGDGYDDGVEVVAGTDPTDRFDGIPSTDFYVVLPFEDPEIHRELDFRARLGRADIFFLTDTTGSMGGAIESIRTSLATTIVPAIADTIADPVMGVGDHKDFPVSPYGDTGSWGGTPDFAILIRQTMTDDVAAVQAALGLLVASGGADGPESQVEGMWEAVNGTCPVPDGGWGGACFREGTHPIIVLSTDVEFHNGPNPVNDYRSPPIPEAHTWAETITSLVEHEVRVIGVSVNSWGFGGATNDERALCEFTNSYDSTGNLTQYETTTDPVTGGPAVDISVINGIVDLVGSVDQDVSSMSRDDASDAVDATQFITAITPLRSSRPTTFDETTFYDVPGGTTVTFDVVFQNDFRPPGAVVQIYRAYIDIHDLMSMTVLDTRNVYVVIPPEGGILF